MSKSTKKKTTKATKDTKSKKRKMKPGDQRFVDEIPFVEITEDQAKAKASDECARPPLADAVVISRGRKLNPDKVRDIRARIAAGEKAADIAAVYDLHPSSIDDIRVGRTWASIV